MGSTNQSLYLRVSRSDDRRSDVVATAAHAAAAHAATAAHVAARAAPTVGVAPRDCEQVDEMLRPRLLRRLAHVLALPLLPHPAERGAAVPRETLEVNHSLAWLG